MSIVVFLLIVLITAFWVYQGLFSSLIMFFDVLASALLAFAFYEKVHGMWSGSVSDGLGHGLALMVVFLVSLVVLRQVTDRLVPDDVQMPRPVAMAGGGIFGFGSAMMLTGMAMIAIQMMPIGSDVFFFERYTSDPETGDVRSSTLGVFGPDKFTFGLVRGLSSDGKFGAGNSLAYAKPDLIEQLYSARAAPQSEAQMFVPANCIKVRDWWVTNGLDHATHEAKGEGAAAALTRSFQTREPKKIGLQYLVATVYVDKSAAPKTRADIRFRIPQFRVIGFDNGNSQEEPSVYLACGMTDLYSHVKIGPFPVGDEQRERLVFFNPSTSFILSDTATQVVAKENGWEFQVAFEVPTNFKPWYVAFKYGGKALVPSKPLKEAPSYAARPLGNEDGPVVAQSQRSLASASDLLLSQIQTYTGSTAYSGFSSSLPVPLLANDSNLQPHLQNNRFGPSGGTHMVFEVTKEFSDVVPDVYEFQVPNGYNMVQVAFNDPQAKSMYGRAIQFAERVAAQTYVIDGAGERHYAIGTYAIAEVGSGWFYEIQYYPNALNEVPERALSGKKLRRITPQVLENSPENKRWFAFLFLVPDSVRTIEKFNSGNGDEISVNLSR